MFDVKDCIGFLTNKGAKVIGESMNRYFQEDKVTRVQWMALYYIFHFPGLTQKALADKLMIKEPTTLHLIDRLEKEELVERVCSGRNRRANELYLTEKGKAAYETILPMVVEFNKEATEGISQEDLQIFKDVLDQMIQNVSK